MYTEITDSYDTQPDRGWVLYDASCSFCTGLMARNQALLEANGFRTEPLQSPWVRDRLKLPEEVLMEEMRVLTRQGEVMGGADALVHLANQMDARHRPWWAWVLVATSRIPFTLPVMRTAYRWVAARRQCRHGACTTAPPQITKQEGIQ